MINNKADLDYYLKEDKRALGRSRDKRPRLFGDEVWKFQIVLRKHEYYYNSSPTPKNKIMKKIYGFRHRRSGVKLGFSIPVNVFGAGLRINHYGLIVVNEGARIGTNCDIHQGVNIGQNQNNGDVPIIGDNVWIGPGAKLFGKIRITDSIAIGANSIVNKDFLEENITIAGSPAKKIKNSGTKQMVTAASIKHAN
ncbi:serine acetyltransferase [Bacillus sp. AFS006103]|nr:serine acetyltransferase [Bacillus sp. AFS006103]